MRKPRETRHVRVDTHDRPVDDTRPASLELSELRHRTENLLQTILGLLNLEARRAEHAETRERLHDLSLRVELLAGLNRRLNAVGSGGDVDAGLLIRDSAAAVILPDEGPIALELEVGELPLDGKRAQSLALLVHEAVTNVARHAFRAAESGKVVIRARGTARAGFVVEIEDNGRGLQSAAGGDGPTSGGLGLRLMRALALSIGGELRLEDGAPGLKLTLLVPPTAPTSEDEGGSSIGAANGRPLRSSRPRRSGAPSPRRPVVASMIGRACSNP